jgi:GNAT superfamily N-acetyltransferase
VKATDLTTIAALNEADLPEAERICRVAFGTFLGLTAPETFCDDRDCIYARWRASHVAAFGATRAGRLVGSVFLTRWGSVGILGPITVDPTFQGSGVAKAMLDASIEQFRDWRTTQNGLFTFAESAKHVALYQKFGFSARFLTAIMTTRVSRHTTAAGWLRFGPLNDAARSEALDAVREIGSSIYPGLDLTAEIASVREQGLGETVLLESNRGIAAFAICHYGPASEAGADTCYIKFAAVRDSPSAGSDFARLLDACEALTAAVGMATLAGGINLARHEAYRAAVSRGYRTEHQGVAMHVDNQPGYCRAGVYAIDDWR